MASMAPSLRCFSPKVTTCSTASKTFSHDVRKASAVSSHEKPACPAGQKQHVRSGQRALSVAPRNFLDDDRLTAAAIHAPHGIKQKNQKAPKRDELESPFGKVVITGGRLMAARTDRSRTFARTHGNLNTLMIGTEAGLLVNESRKAVTAV